MHDLKRTILGHALRVTAGILVLAACASCKHDPRTQPSPGTITRPGYGLATLKSGAEDCAVLLMGNVGSVKLSSLHHPTALPVGTYRIVQCVVQEQGTDGAAWRMANSMGKAGTTVTVVEGQTVQVPCGPPFTAKVSASKQGDAVSFRFDMTGQDGLAYSPATLTRNGQRLGAPKIVIRNEDGQILAQGAFRYG